MLGSVNGGAYQEGPLTIPAKTNNVTVSLKGDKGTLLTAASAYGVAFTASNGVLTGVLNNVTADGSVTGVAGYQVTSAKVVGTYIQFAMKNMSNGQMLVDANLSGLITTPFADQQAMNQLVADKLMATGSVERATTNASGDITVATRTSGGSYAEKTITAGNILIKLPASSAADSIVEAGPATLSNDGKEATVIAAGEDVLDIAADPSVTYPSVFPSSGYTPPAAGVKSTIVALDLRAVVQAAVREQQGAKTNATAAVTAASAALTTTAAAENAAKTTFSAAMNTIPSDLDTLNAKTAWSAWQIAAAAVNSPDADNVAALVTATNLLESNCSSIDVLAPYLTTFVSAVRDWEDALADKVAADEALAKAKDLPFNQAGYTDGTTAFAGLLFSDGLQCYPGDGNISQVSGHGNSWRKAVYAGKTSSDISTGFGIQVLSNQANPVLELYLQSDVTGSTNSTTVNPGAKPVLTLTIDISGIEYAD